MNKSGKQSHQKNFTTLRLWMVLCIFCAVFVSRGNAQSVDLNRAGMPETAAPASPRIQQALRQISAQRIEADIARLVSFHTRNTLSSMDTSLPAGQGVTAAADWIASQFAADSAACGGCLEVRRDTFMDPVAARVPRPTRLTNVYAILRGTDPVERKRMYLVTGHYDSRNSDVENTRDAAPGANDDASGVAVSLECARVLSRLKFPATLVFVAVAGEEQGLDGSRHLAKLAQDEGWQLEGVLNNDIVGGDTTPGDTLQNKSTVRVFSEGIPATATPHQLRMIELLGGENDSPSRELARAIAGVGRSYGPALSGQATAQTAPFHPTLLFRQDRYLRGGDHSSFNAQGFAAVRFTEWRENFHHQHQNVRVENGIQYGDLLRFVDTRYVARVARLNAATLATLASAPGEPQQVQVLVKDVDNSTELTWQAPAGAPAGTHYEVVWRPTVEPDWTRMANAGTATHLTLPVSKDNVIFGVRSVDAAGQRSLVVVPVPAR